MRCDVCLAIEFHPLGNKSLISVSPGLPTDGHQGGRKVLECVPRQEFNLLAPLRPSSNFDSAYSSYRTRTKLIACMIEMGFRRNNVRKCVILPSLDALATAARESLDLLSHHSEITTCNRISQTEVATSVTLSRLSLEPFAPQHCCGRTNIVSWSRPGERRAVSGERCWD